MTEFEKWLAGAVMLADQLESAAYDEGWYKGEARYRERVRIRRDALLAHLRLRPGEK